MRLRYVLGGLAAVHAAPAVAPVVPAVAGALGVRRRNDGEPGVLLSFDDGPHPEGTPAALDILAERGATAAFFLAGEQVERYPDEARAIASAGHLIGLHCHRHANHLRLTPRQIAQDLSMGGFAIKAVTGREPTIYRPPYGIFSAASLAIVRSRGLEPLLWSRWGRDWTHLATPESVTATATGDIGPGDVVLLHDADHYSARGSWRTTIAALPAILDELGSRGLHPAPPA
jgi:peptidoglycan/xylan/chitin deacetylase (PgdA/CDA1 family)